MMDAAKKHQTKILKPLALLATALPIAAIALTTNFLTQHSSELQTPYRYPFDQSLPGNSNTTSSLVQEITFYKERLRKAPKSGLNQAALATAYLKMARATGQNSWYLLAEQTAKKSLSHLPFNNNSAILVLARTAQAQHNFPQAIHLSRQVLESEVGNEDALAILVTSNLAIGKLEEAYSAAETLVNQIPTQGTLALQALVLTAQGKDKEAIDTFKFALAAEEPGEIGTSAWTRVLLGQFYHKRGQLELSEKLYKEALRILPKYPPALVQLAQLEMKKGNHQAAESYYTQLPFEKQARRKLGLSLEDFGF
jgi:tetratricopeptide (TPR) repeat protein